jgi:hypothetical protein
VRALLLVLVLAAVGFVGFRFVERRADERRFGSIASAIAGRDVSIHCQGPVRELVDVDSHYGSVRFDEDGPADEAGLDRPICQALSALARGKDVSDGEGALAVEALAHESYHLAGIRDEGATQCYALQAMRFVAARLDVDPARASVFVELAEARTRTLPIEYQSSGCRDGGPLDLRPETAAFP